MAQCALHPIGYVPLLLQPCAHHQQRHNRNFTTTLATPVKAMGMKATTTSLKLGVGEYVTSKSKVKNRKRGTIIRCSREDHHRGNGNCDAAAADQRFEEPFREAIFELEIMVREPAEVLGGMQERLSVKDLELVLTYFAQEGRDSWCALEVYEWMQRENRVGDDTQKLMMSIMYGWVMKLVEGEQPVEEVKSLLQDMHCVGLKPEFHIVQSIITTYWEKGRKTEALCFVKQMLETGVDSDNEDPAAFLLLKMVRAGEQKEAVQLVRTLREAGFQLRVSAYSAALLAAVKEQEQLTLAQRQLRTFVQSRAIHELEEHELQAFTNYQDNLHWEAQEIAQWAEGVGNPEKLSGIHERLLAMYCIAGKGVEAEQALWQMKFSGRAPPIEMYNTIIGICGFGNQRVAASRILHRMENMGPKPTKKTFTVLIGGFLKGGHSQQAAETLDQMLTRGFRPDPHVMLAVLRTLQKANLVTQYLHLCKTLAQAGMIEPCLLYFYVDALNLCIIRLL